MTDTLPELVTAHSVAKRLGIPLSMALEIPTDALLAMSRYIEGTVPSMDLLREVAAGWEPGGGPFTVDLAAVNKVINFLSEKRP